MLKLLLKKEKVQKVLEKKVVIFGEEISVKVFYTKIQNPELNLNGNIIYVNLPKKYKKIKNLEIVRVAIDKMYDEIARIEIEKVMEETRIMLKGLAPENFEIKRISNKLATMTQDKTLIINPEIVKYSKQILKYVILYEFCHLKYKTNCKSFYEMLKKYMANYEEYNYVLNVA